MPENEKLTNTVLFGIRRVSFGRHGRQMAIDKTPRLNISLGGR